MYSARRTSWVNCSGLSGEAQMQSPGRHGGPPKPIPPQPGPRQPGPPKPGPPKPGPRQPRPGPPQPGRPQPGSPQPWPPQPGPPGPCQPGPPQPGNGACWKTTGAAGGGGAALATPASPIAEKPSAPAIAPVPTIFFSVMAIPFLLLFAPRRPGRIVSRSNDLTWPLPKPCAAGHNCFAAADDSSSQSLLNT